MNVQTTGPAGRTLYMLDDNDDFRATAKWWLAGAGYEVIDFQDAHLAIEALKGLDARAIGRACLLLDVRMPGESGLSLFNRLQASGLTRAWPVIFLTGHAEVSTAVEAVKAGAFDFCEKPFSDNVLVDRVVQALALSCERFAQHKDRQSLQDKVAALTERERAVMAHVLEGLLNKQIAEQLDISVRTVEVHRARVFAKMEVKSAVELARLLHGL